MKEFLVGEFVRHSMKGVGLADVKLQKTPLGEKIVVATARPGLVVGRKGENIKELTRTLKKEFSLENPQVEISEVTMPSLNSSIVAEKIVDFLERFGTTKFKAIGHKVMTEVTDAGASGIEIVISGKIPSARAKSWRFYKGYLKKCGNTALTNVEIAYGTAKLKSGIVGVKVSIMGSTAGLANKITFKEVQPPEAKAQEAGGAPEKPAEQPKAEPPKKRKRSTKSSKQKKESKEQEAAPESEPPAAAPEPGEPTHAHG